MPSEHGTDIQKWADKSMYASEPMDVVLPKVTLLQASPDPLGGLGAMCAMYEGRVIRDLAELTDDDRKRYWEQVQKTHLKAPLEAIDLHFMIEGVTRAFTHQMVRQRTAVYAQESLRFAVKEEIAARPGILVQEEQSGQALKVWNRAVEDIWLAYQTLISHGIPAEEARGLLPHDTLTRLNFKTNLRNLAEHMGNRLCTQAQFEWKMVAVQIKRAIEEYNPPKAFPVEPQGGPTYELRGAKWQFELIGKSDIFKPICFAMGRCPFQADFDRGCTIRERMDSGRASEVRDEEWLLDPTAAWQ